MNSCEIRNKRFIYFYIGKSYFETKLLFFETQVTKNLEGLAHSRNIFPSFSSLMPGLACLFFITGVLKFKLLSV